MSDKTDHLIGQVTALQCLIHGILPKLDLDTQSLKSLIDIAERDALGLYNLLKSRGSVKGESLREGILSITGTAREEIWK